MGSYNNFGYNRERSDTEKKRSPIELTNENYVKQAEDVINNLIAGKSKILTTSKIRKLLALSSDWVAKIQYFKMHTIYEAGREPSVKKFVEEAQIIEQIDKIKADKDKLILFCLYMEALVAYRKYLGGKDE